MYDTGFYGLRSSIMGMELFGQKYSQLTEACYHYFSLQWKTSRVAFIVHQEFRETEELLSSCKSRDMTAITSLDRFTSLAHK